MTQAFAAARCRPRTPPRRFHPPVGPLARTWRGWSGDAGFTPRIAHECADLRSGLWLVATGQAVSILPRLLCDAPPPGAAVRELPGPGRTPDALVHRGQAVSFGSCRPSPRCPVPCPARRRGARVLDVLGRPDNAAGCGAGRRGPGKIRKRRPSAR
ncbi:LysR substrate-binding domain-containing protein [Streptomyces avidinii]|uniref:LysR substrate-binding domain-containing protein n=1 Tax=Streptomyces avidinii TaxID=1895 RepID=UPI0038645B68